MHFKYRAFISYSHHDKKWADWLHKALETYKIPISVKDLDNQKSLELTPIFRDREELPTSSGLSEAIVNALRESKYLIVICSPNAVKSQYVNKEIIDFKSIHGEDSVLAIIVDGEPYAIEKNNSLNPNIEAFPKALKYRVGQDKNLTDERIEPIAADAREIGDGKERAKIKLIAGMLGIGFDDLWRREKRRKKRRNIIIFSIILVLFIIISSLSIFSLLQWKEAEHQKIVALEGRRAAEKLVDHTLFDLRDKLEPMGKLKILRSTQEAVDIYYKELGNMDLSLADKFKIATYYTDSGYYYLNIGNTNKAKIHFETAENRMLEVIKEDPTNLLHQRNLATVYSALGSLFKVQGKLKESKKYYLLSQSTLKNILQMSSNVNIRFQLAKNDGDMAHILQQEMAFGKAKELYVKSLQHIKKLIEKDTTREQWKLDLAVVHTNYGTMLEFLNQYKEAFIQFQDAQYIREKLFNSHLNNKLYEHALWESYLYVGSVYFTYFKNFEESKKYFEKALSIILKLTSFDPINSQWQVSLARNYKKLGDIYAEKELEESSNYYHKALNVLETFMQRNNKESRIEYEYILYCGTVGNFELRQNKTDDAKKYFEKALKGIQKLIKKNPSKTFYQYALAMTYDDLATLYMDYLGKVDIYNFYSQAEYYGEKKKAQEKGLIYREKSYKILVQLKKDDPLNPIWK